MASKPPFKTSVRSDGRKVHTYASGRKVTLPKVKKPSTKTPAVKAPKPVDPYAAQVEADTQTKYGGAESALGSAQRAQEFRNPQIEAWFQRYKDAVTQAGTANAAAGQQAQTNLLAFGNAASANDRAGQAQINSQMQTDATARGATVDPSIAAIMQMASQVRSGNLAGAATEQNARAFAQAGLDNQKVVGVEGSKLAALLDNASKIEALKQKGIDLEADKGAFKISDRSNILTAEQTAALNQFVQTGKLTNAANAVAAKVTTAKIAAKAKTTAASKAAAAKGATINSYGYTARQWAALSPTQRRDIMAAVKKEQRAPKSPKKPTKVKPTTGVGSLTPAQAAKYAGTVPKLLAALKGGKTPDDLTASGPYSPEVNATLVRAAMDLRAYGAVTPATVKRLHAIGVRVNGNFKTISKAGAQAVQVTKSVL